MHKELVIDNFKCFSEQTKIKLGKTKKRTLIL